MAKLIKFIFIILFYFNFCACDIFKHEELIPKLYAEINFKDGSKATLEEPKWCNKWGAIENYCTLYLDSGSLDLKMENIKSILIFGGTYRCSNRSWPSDYEPEVRVIFNNNSEYTGGICWVSGIRGTNVDSNSDSVYYFIQSTLKINKINLYLR